MATNLQLYFTADIEPIIQKRIEYTFGHFCALFDYHYSNTKKGYKIVYSSGSSIDDVFSIPAHLIIRPLTERAPTPKTLTVDGIDFPLFANEPDKPIDWLAEAFEWISGANEYSSTIHDKFDRLKFEESLNGLYNFDPIIPFANVAFAQFNKTLEGYLDQDWLPRPCRPKDSNGLILPNIIDIDFFSNYRI